MMRVLRGLAGFGLRSGRGLTTLAAVVCAALLAATTMMTSVEPARAQGIGFSFGGGGFGVGVGFGGGGGGRQSGPPPRRFSGQGQQPQRFKQRPKAGVGVIVTPSQRYAEDDDDKPVRKPKRTDKAGKKSGKKTQVAISCRGGKVTEGDCVCPSGMDRQQASDTAFRCVRDPKDGNRVTDLPCRGGAVRNGTCVCPAGRKLDDGICRQIVVTPVPTQPIPPVVVLPPVVTVPPVVSIPPVTPIPPVTLAPTTPLPPPVLALPPGPPPAASAPQAPSAPPVAQTPLLDGTFEPDQIVVTLAASTAETVEEAFAQTHNLSILQRRRMGILDRRVVLLRIPDQRSVPQVLAAVANDPRIEASQPNFLYTFQSDGKAQTVPDLQYALAKVGLAPTQRLATGRDTLIAVLDTGVDRAHPDLVNATIDEVDLTGETEGRNRLPEDAHGTAIAGIIGARGVLRGAAPDARLLSLKAFRQSRDGATSTATTYILLTGLDTAAERGAHVINMSFAGPADPALREAVKQCTGRRIVTVAAAGNKGPDAPAAYPAAYPEVIAVTATDSVDRLYGRANRGGYIAVAAPGVDVLTPALAWSHQMQTGTSFAAAHVSAIVALLIERDPSLTPESIRVILVETAKDLGEPGPDREFGAGRADAFAALQRVTAKAGGPGRAKIAAPSPAGTANR